MLTTNIHLQLNRRNLAIPSLTSKTRTRMLPASGMRQKETDRDYISESASKKSPTTSFHYPLSNNSTAMTRSNCSKTTSTLITNSLNNNHWRMYMCSNGRSSNRITLAYLGLLLYPIINLHPYLEYPTFLHFLAALSSPSRPHI